ncbi:Mfa1 family fimbria major subunit [Bacteroides sp. GD17]|jgi:hypothetical protein|uniref:Mfa1 family fimbria major subunit n=1 Tax=Bacteroides sp. GD17 TaxID=3139826 RepID=UPI00313DED01
MKVNFKYAIMAVAALTLGLTSCSNDNDVTGGETDNGTKTYMKVSINFPSTNDPQTRATGDNNATDDEVLIKHVDVYIYTASGAYLSRNRLDASAFKTASVSQDGTTYEAQTKIPTTTGFKSILVGINLPDGIATGLENKTLSEVLTTPQTLTRTQLTNLTNGIPMFSTAVVNGDFVADETDSRNTIIATVQRMVAKVTVEKSSSMTQGGVKGELGTLEFAINNFNERSYLVQKASPNFEDPNWASGSYLSSEFSDAATTADWKTVVTPVADVKDLDAHYAAENTSEGKTMGEITRVTVRATFMPDVITVSDNHGGYETVDRTTLGITVPTTTFYTVTASATSGTAYFYDKNVAESYANDNGLNNSDVNEYENGFCYWNMFLNKETGKKGYQWDVVRNEFFRCQITRIVAPGNPTPEVNNPDQKPDAETNIFTNIEILKWNMITSDYVLEP